MSDAIIAQVRQIVACDHCGHINHSVELTPGSGSYCSRCNHLLYCERRDWLTRANALLITGIILFIGANVLPFIGLDVNGIQQSSTLLSGVSALYDSEQVILSALVLLIIFLFPLIELCLLAYVLLAISTHYRPPGIALCLKVLVKSRPWNMLEIFLVSVLVTSVKLGDAAELIIGLGVISFALLVVTLIALNRQINMTALWRWYRKEDFFSLGPETSVYSCQVCQALVGEQYWQQQSRCPRCHHTIKPQSNGQLERSLALTIAATILYIPAMTLPMMSITSLGQTTEQTLLSGIMHLFHEGMWFIGFVVFFASVVVPIAKLGIMYFLLVTTYRSMNTHQRGRLTLYRLTEFIGRWSMIDVFVIALLVALVQFGALMTIQPQSAALAFAMVVVLTMFAASAFDPRLIWKPSNGQ